ncbi:hypothetical protein FJT64_023962 [Amphibalanus amphitrite]|uniref:Protein CUSTOS n=1 Tax=Amphibalanus amphitrite TaxID=1232801 RepID=A0A6A4W8U0_AMPAM|nr:hypothetical protein FJT64_023962 [Amphibalanus amphitrite]
MNVSRAEMGGAPAEGDWRELDTTPEFREFVGKKLDQLVSSMIKEKDRCKHLRPAPVEGEVRLFAGAPPLQVAEEAAPEPPPPAKRPRLSGVELQRYQLKKKGRRERQPATPDAVPPPSGGDGPVSQSPDSGGEAVPAVGGGGKDSDSDSDDDLARFAEAAVPADFMKSLAKSKTVKLGTA